MAIQDFTTWTETDPNSHAVVSKTEISYSSASPDSSTLVEKDYSNNSFSGDFRVTFELVVSSYNTGAVSSVCMFDTTSGIAGSGNEFLINISQSSPFKIAGVIDGGSDSSIELELGVIYLIEVIRKGLVYTIVISKGGSLVDTLTITASSVDDYKFIKILREGAAI